MIATLLEEAVRPCKRPIELSAVDLNQKRRRARLPHGHAARARDRQAQRFAILRLTTALGYAAQIGEGD